MFGWLVGSFVLVLRPTREYESNGRGLYHHHHHRRRRSLISKRYYFRYRAAKFDHAHHLRIFSSEGLKRATLPVKRGMFVKAS